MSCDSVSTKAKKRNKTHDVVSQFDRVGGLSATGRFYGGVELVKGLLVDNMEPAYALAVAGERR